jgi:hypothetical protein
VGVLLACVVFYCFVLSYLVLACLNSCVPLWLSLSCLVVSCLILSRRLSEASIVLNGFGPKDEIERLGKYALCCVVLYYVVLSYVVLSCRILPCLVLPSLVLSCLFLSSLFFFIPCLISFFFLYSASGGV